MQSRCQDGLFQNRWSGSHFGSLSVTAMLAAVSVQSGVPHVIKTWLIIRMLLLTISATNGEREREREWFPTTGAFQKNHVSSAHVMKTGSFNGNWGVFLSIGENEKCKNVVIIKRTS